MSASFYKTASSYEARSLKHEQHMLSLYREAAPNDTGLLQPLANACLRAASFEWTLSKDVRTVRRLWGEAASALAQGFARKGRFDPSPDQFILATTLSIAAREAQAFSAISKFAPGVRSTALKGAQAFRGAKGHFHLAESFALIACAILEKRGDTAASALHSLNCAIDENDEGWWRLRFPDPGEARWLSVEHLAICQMLRVIILCSTQPNDQDSSNLNAARDSFEHKFSSLVDETLAHLQWFLDSEENHHPKLYIWIPGIALTILAIAAGLPTGWLLNRHQVGAAGYDHLPLELIFTEVQQN